MYEWHGGCECSLAGLSNPSLFVHVERDIRLLVDGDDFMVEMPTREEKWFEEVSFSKYDGKGTGMFHSDGNTLTETSFLNRVVRLGSLHLVEPRWRLIRGTPQWCFEIWDLKIVSCCDSCGQASEVGRTSTAGRSETSERRGHHVVQVSYKACELPVSGLVICCRLWHEG